MSKKQLVLILSTISLLGVTLGCGSSGTVSSPLTSKPEFLFVMALQPPSNAELLAFNLDPSTETLTPSSTTGAPLTFGIAADSTSKSVYISNGDLLAPAIDIFSIDQMTGSLTASGTFTLAGVCPFCSPPSSPGALSMDSKGKFLYYSSDTIGSTLSQGLGALAVDTATGALTPVPGSPFPADDFPDGVLVHPSGHFIYTENTSVPPTFPLSLKSISGFSVDSATGALAPVPNSPFTPPVTADLTGFKFHPGGEFLYASTGSAANGILGWSVDNTTGTLSRLPASPFASGTTVVGITIDPTGKFLYTGNGGQLSGFNIDAGSGTLTAMSGSPFETGGAIGSLVIDPSGQILVAGDLKNQTIILLKINALTGALTPLGSPTPISGGPISMVMATPPQ
jgi:6-phosphogluconolactonase